MLKVKHTAPDVKNTVIFPHLYSQQILVGKRKNLLCTNWDNKSKINIKNVADNFGKPFS